MTKFVKKNCFQGEVSSHIIFAEVNSGTRLSAQLQSYQAGGILGQAPNPEISNKSFSKQS